MNTGKPSTLPQRMDGKQLMLQLVVHVPNMSEDFIKNYKQLLAFYSREGDANIEVARPEWPALDDGCHEFGIPVDLEFANNLISVGCGCGIIRSSQPFV